MEIPHILTMYLMINLFSVVGLAILDGASFTPFGKWECLERYQKVLGIFIVAIFLAFAMLIGWMMFLASIIDNVSIKRFWLKALLIVSIMLSLFLLMSFALRMDMKEFRTPLDCEVKQYERDNRHFDYLELKDEFEKLR